MVYWFICSNIFIGFDNYTDVIISLEFFPLINFIENHVCNTYFSLQEITIL